MRKTWLVAAVALVLFMAGPASAVSYDVHRKFKDDSKLRLGCVLFHRVHQEELLTDDSLPPGIREC